MQRKVAGRSARYLIPAVVAVLAFISGSVFVATGQSQAQTYFACAAANGQLSQIRVDSAPSCGPNQSLVSWESGSVPSWSDLTGIPADFQDGSIGWSEVDGVPGDLADGDDVGLTSVAWGDLQDVPAGFADGVDNIDGGTAADLACSECVDGDEVADGSLSAADLGTDSVGSDEVDNNSLTSADIATNAVGSVELTDGDVRTDDLANGAVTTMKQTANWTQAIDGNVSLSNGTTTNLVGPVSLHPGGSAGDAHVVLVTVEVDVRCVFCGGGNAATVDIVVQDGTTSLASKRLTFDEAEHQESITISRLVVVDWTTPFTIVVKATTSTTGLAEVFNDITNLIMVDLGRDS